MDIVPNAARIALECIGNSDALYHNIEHTMLVTLAGHDIFRGRALYTNVTADDYAHTIIACLTHDIGYVRGLLRGDDADSFVIDATGKKVVLPRGSSDAALMPYHVDRSKLYVMERIEGMPSSTSSASRVPSKAPDFLRVFPATGREGGLDRSRRRFYRTTRRPQLHQEGQCALLRVRRDRHEPSAGL